MDISSKKKPDPELERSEKSYVFSGSYSVTRFILSWEVNTVAQQEQQLPLAASNSRKALYALRSKPTKEGHAFHMEKQFHYYAHAYN